MNPEKIIRGKKILIVDDEKDVLETLIELLSLCKLDTASSFEAAKKLLQENEYDVAILDIMGVDGFELLKVAKERRVPALMLTAHGLSQENLLRSEEEGAAYYAPKDEMANIRTFLADVVEAIEKKKSPWERLFERLGGYYDRRFGGTDWREKHREYFKEKTEIHL